MYEILTSIYLIYHEIFNSIYEVHAFLIAFGVAYPLFLLVAWAYLRTKKESVWEELAIVFMMAVGLLIFLCYIPEWVMENNLYQNPWYALGGFFVGLHLGVFVAHIIFYKFKDWIGGD